MFVLQEVQTNSAIGVLSAPDLQLDWVSDSSDDDVQVVQEFSNSVSFEIQKH